MVVGRWRSGVGVAAVVAALGAAAVLVAVGVAGGGCGWWVCQLAAGRSGARMCAGAETRGEGRGGVVE